MTTYANVSLGLVLVAALLLAVMALREHRRGKRALKRLQEMTKQR